MAWSMLDFDSLAALARVVIEEFSVFAVGIWVEQIVPHRLDVGMVLGI